jgi:hypothetical protein
MRNPPDYQARFWRQLSIAVVVAARSLAGSPYIDERFTHRYSGKSTSPPHRAATCNTDAAWKDSNDN